MVKIQGVINRSVNSNRQATRIQKSAILGRESISRTQEIKPVSAYCFESIKMSEKQIQTQILNAIGSRPDVRLFRNNVGVALNNERPLRFGLCNGSSDLIGIQKIVITPDMVGQEIGRFLSIECKSDKGRTTKSQTRWLEMVRNFGGKSFIARSAQEAQERMESQIADFADRSSRIV